MLTEQEKELVKTLDSRGYSPDDIMAHIGAMRAGRTSSVNDEEKQRIQARQDATNKSFLQRAQSVGEFFTSPETIDVLGANLARGPLGSLATGQSKDVLQSIPAPSRRETAGAFLQTGSILADVALAPVSLPAQIAVGTGAGYLYDVGQNLVEGDNALTPGVGTAFGAAVPIGLGLAGKGLNALATPGPALGSANRVAGATVDTAVEQAADVVPSAVTQKAREIATTPRRVAQRVAGATQETADRAAIRETLTEPAQKALDTGLGVDTVQFVDSFDEATRAAARQMVAVSDNARGGVRPEEIPGEYVNQQLEAVIGRKRQVGERIGELSAALPNQSVDMAPTHRTLVDVLSQNRIRLEKGKLVFDNKRISPEQQRVLNDLYTLVTSDKTLTPTQIHEFDQQLSALYRESKVKDQVGDIYLTYLTQDGNKITRPAHLIFRDVFSDTLSQLSPEMRAVNKEYAKYKNLEEVVTETIAPQAKELGIDINSEEAIGIALRRVFSNAASQPKFKAAARELDVMARELGYEGPTPTQLMEFYLKDLKPLYPETVAPASFEGGIMGGIRGVLSNIADLGRVTNSDQKRALKELLQMSDTSPQVLKEAGAESVAGVFGGIQTDEDGNITVNPYGAAAGVVGASVAKRLVDIDVKPDVVAKNIDAADVAKLDKYVSEPENLQAYIDVQPLLRAVGIAENAEEKLKVSFIKEVLTEYARRITT